MAKAFPGVRLADSDDSPFLVILVPREEAQTPGGIRRAWIRLSYFEFPVVIATPSGTGQYRFFGEHSLTSIACAKIGEHTEWQSIEIHKPPQIT